MKRLFFTLSLSFMCFGLKASQMRPMVVLNQAESKALTDIFEFWAPANVLNQEIVYKKIISLINKYPKIINFPYLGMPNNPYKAGTTILQAASHKNNIPLMSKLIALGANVNARGYLGNTALMYAAHKNLLQAVQLLIASNADLNIGNNEGETALMVAAKGKAVKAAELLIAAGAQVNWQANKGQSSLMAASKEGSSEIVKLLLAAGAQVDMQDLGGNTALLYAGSAGHVAVMQLLLEAGADINVRNMSGYTAFIQSILTGHAQMMQFLIDTGKLVHLDEQVNSFFRDTGKTRLISAAEKGYTEVVKILLNLRAQVNAQDNQGFTALMYAAKSGGIEMAKLLLNAGAEQNMQNKEGVTALMLAAENGKYEIVKLLIMSGAKITLRNENDGNKTARDYALDKEKFDIAVDDGRAHRDRYNRALPQAMQQIAQEVTPECTRYNPMISLIGEYAYSDLPADLPPLPAEEAEEKEAKENSAQIWDNNKRRRIAY